MSYKTTFDLLRDTILDVENYINEIENELEMINNGKKVLADKVSELMHKLETYEKD